MKSLHSHVRSGRTISTYACVNTVTSNFKQYLYHNTPQTFISYFFRLLFHSLAHFLVSLAFVNKQHGKAKVFKRFDKHCSCHSPAECPWGLSGR
jgi:hypothetical protein